MQNFGLIYGGRKVELILKSIDMIKLCRQREERKRKREEGKGKREEKTIDE